MDLVRNPLKPLVRSIIVVVIEKAWVRIQLASECIGSLGTRSPMKDDNHIQASILGPSDDLIQVLLTALSKVFRLVDDALEKPIANWNTNSVETVRHHLLLEGQWS
jgi:hypothetical protein